MVTASFLLKLVAVSDSISIQIGDAETVYFVYIKESSVYLVHINIAKTLFKPVVQVFCVQNILVQIWKVIIFSFFTAVLSWQRSCGY